MLHFFQTVLSPNHNYVTVQDTNYWVTGLDRVEWRLLDEWCRGNLPKTVTYKTLSFGISLCLPNDAEHYYTRDALETRMKELEEIERVFFRELELLRQPKIFWTPSVNEVLDLIENQNFDLLRQANVEGYYDDLLQSFTLDGFIVMSGNTEKTWYQVFYRGSDGVLDWISICHYDPDEILEKEDFPLADFMAYCTCHGSASEFHTLWYEKMTFVEKLHKLVQYSGIETIL